MDTVIGIDPGANGAIVVLRGNAVGWIIERCFRIGRGEDAIADLFRNQLVLAPDETVAYIERVTGFGGGIGLKLRENYGFLRGVLKMRGIHVVDVTPQRWMAAMGVEGKSQTKEKRQSMRMLASQVQDDVESTNWNAAAILIGHYGIRTEREGESADRVGTGQGLRD